MGLILGIRVQSCWKWRQERRSLLSGIRMAKMYDDIMVSGQEIRRSKESKLKVAVLLRFMREE